MRKVIRHQKGFTLIEALVAISIYTILIATLVSINKTGINTINQLEERVIANQALKNVLIEFKATHNINRLGRFVGEYKMSHFSYYWEIVIESTQDRQTKILNGAIFFDKDKKKAITSIKDSL